MATKRRQYGTGSVYQRSSDGRWIGSIQAGWNQQGKRRVITVSCSAEKGEAECRRLLRQRQNQIAREGLPTEGVGSRATVQSWSEAWLPIMQRELRPKSYATTASAVRRWIVPTIGKKRLEQLTPGDVRAVADAIRAAGKSSSTALRTHRDLIQMLEAAIVEGHPIPARVLAVKAPSKAVSDRDAIPYDHAIALLRAAAELPDGSRWVAALLQGMRQGECLGLTWECVDLQAHTLDVSWQLQALPPVNRFERNGPLRVPDGYEYRRLSGALCLVRPKSQAGRRIIPLVPWMSAALAHWRTLAPASPHDLVWPKLTGEIWYHTWYEGRPRQAKEDREEWKALQRAAKVAHPSGRLYGLHEARHTTATLLLAEGTDPAVVTAIMGHSNIATSRLYQHVNQAMAREALDRIADRLQLNAKPLD